MSEDQAYYFIKLYTFEHQSLLAVPQENRVVLTPIGQIVADEWVRSAIHHQNIQLDKWVVLPDQVTGIVALKATTGGALKRSLQTSFESTKPRLLSSFVAGFKAAAAKRINLLRSQPGDPVWQRSYSEQLIANSDMLQRLRQQLGDPGAN